MITLPTNLVAMRQAGVLTAVDVHLASLLARLSGETQPDAMLAAALACQWPQRGHACVDLHDLVSDHLLPVEDTGALPRFELPEPESWLQSLRASSFVGLPAEKTPLVLWQDRWLYLRRSWQDETRLTEAIQAWSETAGSDVDKAVLEKRTARVFDSNGFDREDQQQQATLLAVQQPLFVLTGGPGTGKTSTLLRLMAVLLETEPQLSIALAAPTGKAALRIRESLLQGLEDLNCDGSVKSRIPTEAQTLHRLLGYQSRRAGFRHNERQPVPYDVVVVDEASMMGLSLTAKLLAALPRRCRLVLVGDREQLPSVDSGSVFADLCAEESYVPHVELTRNYRFSAGTGIGALAAAIRCGDAARTVSLLDEDLQPLPVPHQLKDALWARLQAYLSNLQNATDPEAAFSAFEQLRVLCAHRTGPFGAEAVNQAIHELLVSRFKVDRLQRWYPGRPILISENDYSAECFNGDTGLVLPWQGKLYVFFRQGGGDYRRLPPACLPAHESAYAMTVHKSQGSEFDEVLLLLTDRPSRLLTRELLYTGVTRARRGVQVWSPQANVEACVDTQLHRTSGLRARFAAGSISE